MHYAAWLAALILVTIALMLLSDHAAGLAVILAVAMLAGVVAREMPKLKARFNF